MKRKWRKGETTIDELVSMIQRGELRLPEMKCRYVWRSKRVRDLGGLECDSER